MGETDQKIPIIDEHEQAPDGVHPQSMNQEEPWLLQQTIYSGASLAADYGWYFLISAAISYYIWLKLQPKLNKWHEQREAAEHHKNPDKFAAQLRGSEAARERLQEKYNEECRIRTQQMKEEEEKRKRDRLESKEKLLGAQNTRACEDKDNIDKSKKRISFRPDFNPLMSHTSGGFRSGRGSRGG